jgi:hypothetical protein
MAKAKVEPKEDGRRFNKGQPPKGPEAMRASVVVRMTEGMRLALREAAGRRGVATGDVVRAVLGAWLKRERQGEEEGGLGFPEIHR